MNYDLIYIKYMNVLPILIWFSWILTFSRNIRCWSQSNKWSLQAFLQNRLDISSANVTFNNKSKENLLPKVIWFSIDYSIKLKIGVRLLYLVFSCRRVIQNVSPLGEPLEIRFNSKSIRTLLWCYILDILEYLLSPSCFEFRPTWNN